MADPFYLIVSVVVVAGVGISYLVNESGRSSRAEKKYANADPALRRDMLNKVIRTGMTEEQVVDSWGRPTSRTVQRLKTKTKTTLRFGRSYVYFDNGSVTGWRIPK